MEGNSQKKTSEKCLLPLGFPLEVKGKKGGKTKLKYE